MKASEIEPGGVYEGKSGHPREVIRFARKDDDYLYYRTIFPRYRGMATLQLVSEFARWATREVTNDAA